MAQQGATSCCRCSSLLRTIFYSDAFSRLNFENRLEHLRRLRSHGCHFAFRAGYIQTLNVLVSIPYHRPASCISPTLHPSTSPPPLFASHNRAEIIPG